MWCNNLYKIVSILIIGIAITIIGCSKSDPDKQERERLTEELLSAQKRFNQQFRNIRKSDYPLCNEAIKHFRAKFKNVDSDMQLLFLLEGKALPEEMAFNAKDKKIIPKVNRGNLNKTLINILKIERKSKTEATLLIQMIRGKLRAQKITLTMKKKSGKWAFFTKIVSIS